jgi:hypothetical protein
MSIMKRAVKPPLRTRSMAELLQSEDLDEVTAKE